MEYGITPEQYETLARPLNSSRVAKRTQGQASLSYLEAFDVRAHLIRIFGYGNFDIEMLDYHHVATREYETTPRNQNETAKPMVEVLYAARIQLTVRDPHGIALCTYTDGSVGSASGPAYMLGECHDNALKTASSDAMKRCAMNLGNQFGLSLYDKGSTRDIIKRTLVRPPVPEQEQAEKAGNGDLSAEQAKVLRESLGATLVPQNPPVAPETGTQGSAHDSEREA